MKECVELCGDTRLKKIRVQPEHAAKMMQRNLKDKNILPSSYLHKQTFKTQAVFPFLNSSRATAEEGDLMRQCDHSLPSDLANITGKSCCFFFSSSAEPHSLFFSLWLPAFMFHKKNQDSQSNTWQQKLLLCR